jgi:hypothetical protein
LGAGADLSSFVVHWRDLPPFVNELTANWLDLEVGDRFGGDRAWKRDNAIGLAPIVLVLVAWLLRHPWKQQVHVWSVAAVCMGWMALGTVLAVNGVGHASVPMPYALVQETSLFRALRQPIRFMLPFSVAWSMLVACGVAAIYAKCGKRVRLAHGLVGLCTVLMLAEHYHPMALSDMKPPKFLSTLAERKPECAVIDLPMGRQSSKSWMYLQTFHGLPIAEGMAARMPPKAYDHLHNDPLLGPWRRRGISPRKDLPWQAARLRTEGFCYLIVHYNRFDLRDDRLRSAAPTLKRFFSHLEPIFEDETMAIYDLEDIAG